MIASQLLFLTVLVHSFHLEGVVLTGPQTSPFLTEAFQTLQSENLTLSFLYFSYQTLDLLSDSPPLFIVDATFSLPSSFLLNSFSSSFGVILLKMGPPQQDSHRNKWKFYSSPSIHYEILALDSLIDFFDWESFHVFSSQKKSSLKSAKYFKQVYGDSIYEKNLNILTDTVGVDVFVDYIGRLIKPSGIWKFLVFNEEGNIQKIVEALDQMKMLKKGCGVILRFKGVSQIKEGIILIAEQGTQTSSDYYNFQVKQVQIFLNSIQTILNSLSLRNEVSTDRILEVLQELTIQGSRVPKYLILNSQIEDVLTQIGSIQGSDVILKGNLTLPGGQTIFTNDILQLRYSQNSGYINHLGQFHYGNYIFFGAIQVYIDIINQDETQLQNFLIVPTDVDCGSRYFYYDYFKECFQGFRDSLGLFYLHSASQVTYDTVQLFRQMEITTTQIGQYPLKNELYQKQLYPQIVFSTTLRQLMFAFLPTFLLYNGWTNIVAFQTHKYNLDGISGSFYANCQSNSITIHNSQGTRVFPDYYTTSQHFQQYKSYFQEFYNSGVRVFVLLQM